MMRLFFFSREKLFVARDNHFHKRLALQELDMRRSADKRIEIPNNAIKEG
jgi:hypothetical protein